jgi:small subunit ribosomal protein S20
MANVESAKKRIRQTAKRTVRNRHVRTSVRTYIKRVREAVKGGDAKAAQTALAEAIRAVDMAVSKGVYHRRTGSRYVARMSQQVRALGK